MNTAFCCYFAYKYQYLVNILIINMYSIVVLPAHDKK